MWGGLERVELGADWGLAQCATIPAVWPLKMHDLVCCLPPKRSSHAPRWECSDDDFEDAEEAGGHEHEEQEEEEERLRTEESADDMSVDEQPAPSNVAIEFAVQGKADDAQKAKKSPRRVRFTAQDKVRVVLNSSALLTSIQLSSRVSSSAVSAQTHTRRFLREACGSAGAQAPGWGCRAPPGAPPTALTAAPPAYLVLP
jgi:hypothetical protein